ncbi:MAG: tetratricopeptide repeat protein [Chloroflexota bacterium]
MEQAGARGEWLVYLNEGIALCQNQHDERAEAEISLHIGYLYLLLHQYDNAGEKFRRCKSLFEQLNDNSGQGRALNRLAMVALRQGKYATTRELAERALTYLNTNNVDRANSYYVIGTTKYEIGNAKEALPYLEKSLGIWRQLGSKRQIVWGLRNLGPAYMLDGQTDAAIYCYQDAITILQQINDPLSQAIIQLNLGVVKSGLGEYGAALKLYEDALRIFNELSDKEHIAKSHVNMGIELRLLGKFKKSEKVLKESIHLLETLQNERAICNSMFELCLTYHESKSFAKANELMTCLTERLKPLMQNNDTSTFAKKNT